LKAWARRGAWLLLLLPVAALSIRLLPLRVWAARLLDWASGTGTPGLAGFALIYMMGAILFLPGFILTLGAGAVFGLARGTLAVWAGATLGAAASFLIARYFARAKVALWLQDRRDLDSLDAALGRHGVRVVLLARLSPLLPYNLLNYFFGLTRVGFWSYLLASWTGMLPGIILYVYLGFAGRAIAGRSAGPGVGYLWDVIFWGMALIATSTLALTLATIARKALSRERR
jgi:uncharacterized membrane protein YdjX (TVP38/TMEM64 family)